MARYVTQSLYTPLSQWTEVEICESGMGSKYNQRKLIATEFIEMYTSISAINSTLLTLSLDLHLMRRHLLTAMEGTQLNASLHSIKQYAGPVSKKGLQRNNRVSALESGIEWGQDFIIVKYCLLICTYYCSLSHKSSLPQSLCKYPHLCPSSRPSEDEGHHTFQRASKGTKSIQLAHNCL